MKKLISLLLSVAVSILTCVTAFVAVPARNNDQVAPCYEIMEVYGHVVNYRMMIQLHRSEIE